MKQIAVFNHKGGVAKTTTTFHLAWKLAQLGHRIMLVDCDPQCNLTGAFLGEFKGDDYPFESMDSRNPKNIRDAVRPPFESRPYPISAVELVQTPFQENLYLLPGHVGLAEYESQLAVAHEVSNTLSALQNIPGALRFAIEKTAAANDIDFALVDMSPSLGAINQNLFMTSEAFFIPMAPDLFSAMALRSLSRVLPKWADWGKQAAENPILRTANYPFPEILPKYLGSIVQNFQNRAHGTKPTKAFQVWLDKLKQVKNDDLLNALNSTQMLLPDETYKNSEAPTDGFLMEIGNFDSLVAVAQDLAKPVFAIDPASDIGVRGNVAMSYQAEINNVNQNFDSGAKKIVALTEDIQPGAHYSVEKTIPAP